MTSKTLISKALTSKIMPLNPIKAITLIANEQPLPPLGEAPIADRPVSFAAIFIQMENPSDRPQWVTLEQVQVVDASDRTEILRSAAPQSIKLMPLENATIDVQLSSPDSYGKREQVMAIAHYRIGDQLLSLESPAVEIR
jgi:hypothetical protein